jgi:DNA-binding NtrC family response regulator
MRVGGSVKVSVDTRLVCATLRPLARDVAAGRFRSDLFYRIEGITLNVPPLRARPVDIEPLALEFIAELSAFHDVKPPKLGRAAVAKLQALEWPGNVRQLRNAMERVCLLRPGLPIRPEDLVPSDVPLPPAPPITAPPREHANGRLEVSIDDPIDKTIQHVLVAALAAEGGNRTRAAERLGMSLRTVQRRLRRMPH